MKFLGTRPTCTLFDDLTWYTYGNKTSNKQERFIELHFFSYFRILTLVCKTHPVSLSVHRNDRLRSTRKTKLARKKPWKCSLKPKKSSLSPKRLFFFFLKLSRKNEGIHDKSLNRSVRPFCCSVFFPLFYRVIPWHIFCVIKILFGKMTYYWNDKRRYPLLWDEDLKTGIVGPQTSPAEENARGST